jgi:hypothetical protein
MNFLLTKYIYPIEAKSLLSKKLNIFFDNPRTDEEIEDIAEYLRYSESIDHGTYAHNWRLPRAEEVDFDDEVLTLEGIVNNFLERYAPIDIFVEKFRNKNENTEIFIKLAKMWIVARYDDEGQIQALKKESIKLSEEGSHGFFLLDDDNPIVRNSKNLVNYSYLLSLLIHTEREEYFGKTFLIHHSEHELRSPKIDKWLNQHLVYFGFFSYSGKSYQDPLDWEFYPLIKNELYRVAETVDFVLDDTSTEKILYVANLLAVAGNEVNDEKVMLMVLVGIIELLLTHSPDSNRFNVEDSISKQFKLKASTLIYLNDRGKDLDHIKKRLGIIYSQRSNIAHGNFKQLDKYIKNLSKKEGEEEYFEDLVHDLYSYLRAILCEYVRDRNFVEFLKDN